METQDEKREKISTPRSDAKMARASGLRDRETVREIERQ